MIKKIILLLVVLSPFITYYICKLIFKYESKKYPIIKLSIISLFLLILSFSVFRYYNAFPPDSKYTPPKYEDGKLKSPKTE